jgi:hypothetical protein
MKSVSRSVPVAVRRAYRPGTTILETVFVTATGTLRLTDFMPLHPLGQHSQSIDPSRATSAVVQVSPMTA